MFKYSLIMYECLITSFVQETEYCGSSSGGDGSLSFHSVTSGIVSGCDTIFRL